MQFAQIAMKNYLLDHAYDEMFATPGELHSHYELLLDHFSSLPADELRRRKQAADLSFLNQGITFTVYGRQEGTEKIFLTIFFPASSPQPSGARSNTD